MKVAISSEGPNWTDQVDPHFGRAGFFVLYDTTTEAFETIDNSKQTDAVQGAGVQTAQHIVELGAGVVLTGRCGPKAYQVLAESGVEIYSGLDGTVRQAIQAWTDGNLTRLAGPDGKGRH